MYFIRHEIDIREGRIPLLLLTAYNLCPTVRVSLFGLLFSRQPIFSVVVLHFVSFRSCFLICSLAYTPMLPSKLSVEFDEELKTGLLNCDFELDFF